MADAELRQQRKLAYYRALAREDPAFSPSLPELCRRLDGILAPFSPNGVRWELLDATHGGSPPDQIIAFRAIVAECEQQAHAATGQEAARWHEQAELPRRFGDVLDAAHQYALRWKLPEDGATDIIDAYLSGDERLAPPEPVRFRVAQPLIRLQPPPRTLFSNAPTAIEAAGLPHPAWVIPYDPAPPAADNRRDLEERLEILFAFLRDQALQEAARLEVNALASAQPGGTGAAEGSDLAIGAGLLFIAVHRPPRARGANPVYSDTVAAGMVKDWAADLGITLPLDE